MRDRARKRLLNERPMLLLGSHVYRFLKVAEDQQQDSRPSHSQGGAHEGEATPRVLHRAIQGAGTKESIMKDEGVVKVSPDQCQGGCADSKKNHVKKTTSFMTNAPELSKELGKRCSAPSGKCSRPEKGPTHNAEGRPPEWQRYITSKCVRPFWRQLPADGVRKDEFGACSRQTRKRLRLYRVWCHCYMCVLVARFLALRSTAALCTEMI